MIEPSTKRRRSLRDESLPGSTKFNLLFAAKKRQIPISVEAKEIAIWPPKPEVLTGRAKK